MDTTFVLLLIAVFIWALVWACLGGWIATQKHRPVTEGAVLGAVFGPLGILVEALLPTRTAEEAEALLAEAEADRKQRDRERYAERLRRYKG